MHVVSRRALREFWTRHPDSKQPQSRWFKLLEKQDFNHFTELRSVFPSVDRVGDFTVFNIGGNKYRLIASIHFNHRKVLVRHILTHAEYDKGRWKK